MASILDKLTENSSYLNGYLDYEDGHGACNAGRELDRDIGKARDFIQLIARMNYDGEELPDGEEFLMENDDAVETLNQLIHGARKFTENARVVFWEFEYEGILSDGEYESSDEAMKAADEHFAQRALDMYRTPYDGEKFSDQVALHQLIEDDDGDMRRVFHEVRDVEFVYESPDHEQHGYRGA